MNALVKSVSGVSPQMGKGSRAHSQSPAIELAGWLSTEGGEGGADAEEGED